MKRGCAILLLLALSATLAHAQQPSAADRQLERAALAYARGSYRRVIALLRPVLYPTIQLSNPGAVLRAHKLLGISYVLLKDRPAAEKELMAILAQSPDHRLDPLVDPVAAVELFDDLKRRNADKLRVILERERKEAEARRKAAERKERERLARERQRDQESGEIIERSTERRHLVVSLLPLGAGQFQNGHRRKGYALLGTQLALGTLSLSCAIALRAGFSGPLPAERYTLAQRLNGVQVISGALFLGALAYGIIDALVYYRPQVSVERRFRKRPLGPALVLGQGTLGAGLGGAF